MVPGRTVVGFLHPGHWSACFGHSLHDLLFHDLFGPQRIVSHPFGEMGKETGTGQIPAGRNLLARVALDDADAEWLFMVDSDMGFAPDAVERLIEAADPVERPVVGALCFAVKSAGRGDFYASRYRCVPTIYRWAETDERVGFVPMLDYPRDALVECGASGAACVLIHRSALEKIRAKYGDEWFDPLPHPKAANGHFGEDLSFCIRLAACDVPIHVHTGVKTTHDKGGVFFDEETYDLQQAMLADRE